MDCNPLSTGFSRQEYWSGLPCPLPGDLPQPRIKPVSLMSPALTGKFFITSATWEAIINPEFRPGYLVSQAKPTIPAEITALWLVPWEPIFTASLPSTFLPPPWGLFFSKSAVSQGHHHKVMQKRCVSWLFPACTGTGSLPSKALSPVLCCVVSPSVVSNSLWAHGL